MSGGNLLRSYPQNLKGRDFICSDLHGHFHLLEEKLAEADFDEAIDRVFSLGDLIDRGDQSGEVIHWLNKPWFHAIQGNHEQMLIDVMQSRAPEKWMQWMFWGGDWAEDLQFEDLQPICDALINLPAAIEIGISVDQAGNQHKVALVHAELPDYCDWNDIRDQLTGIGPGQINRDPVIRDMLWKKSQPAMTAEQQRWVTPVENLQWVFHGHSVVDDFLHITNRTFMDLGSYKTGRIGFIELASFLKDQRPG